MSYSSNIISEEQVSINDVHDALGEDNYNLGKLCSNANGKTNFWAKYKPISRKGDFINLTDDDWWKGEDGNCGLVMSQYVNVILLAAAYNEDDEMNGWSYKAPVGGEGSPFRLLDFAGYYSAASAPWGTFSVPEKVLWSEGTSATLDISVAPTPPHPNALGITDFSVFYNNYFGFYVVHSGGTKFAITATSILSDGGRTVSIPLNQFSGTGTLNLYPFFGTKQWTVGSVGGGVLYTLPKVQPYSCELVSSIICIIWNNSASLPSLPSNSATSTSTFTVNFTIKNTYVNTYSFTKVLLITSFKTTFEEAAKDSASHQVTLTDSFQLSGNSSVTKTASMVFTYQSSSSSISKPQNLFIRAYYGIGGVVDFYENTPPYIQSAPS